LILIKFHELCCNFYEQVHIYGGNGTNEPHEPGTTAQPGTASPAGAAGHAKCGRTYPRAMYPVPNISFPTCTTWMNKVDQGNVGLIEWMKL
jgi:hypothetical protein